MDAPRLDLDDLLKRCQLESTRYFQGKTHEPAYCFELFRRAFVSRDAVAWHHLYTVYQPLVAGWIKSNQSFSGASEEVQYFINRTYEKMWTSISEEKFTHFPDLTALLRYLKMCAGSAVIDHLRATTRLQLEALVEPLASQFHPTDSSLENLTFDRVQSEAFWQQVMALLKSKEEHCVVHGFFVLGLKPRELQAQFPGVFEDIQHLYRVKENVLARLRRNHALVEYLREYAGEKL